MKPRITPIATYINDKIRMLKKHFYIKLTDEEIAHMESLTTEISVDNYAHKLIMTRI